MLVPITSDGVQQQWTMIEMQGEIERTDGGGLDEAFNVGTLAAIASVQGDSVLLTIGYHQLEGKRLPLKKPLAVLERSDGESQGTSYKTHGHRDVFNSGPQVVGVIRDKYMFKARPRALITKPEEKQRS